METPLPEPFRDLEPFTEWAIPTMEARIKKRLSVELEEARAFYDAIIGSIDEILDYLNQYQLNELPDDAKTLFYMTLSLAEISTSVEYYGEMRVPKAIGHERFPMIPPSGAW